MSDALRRVVIDPNVFVSAAITSSGATATIVELIDAAGLTPIRVASPPRQLTDEVLMRGKFRAYLSVETASGYVTELERLAELWGTREMPRRSRPTAMTAIRWPLLGPPARMGSCPAIAI